jgi:hypothetical protein
MTLKEKRERLADQVSYSYSPESFPGSADWIENRKHQAVLDDFDATHPEIIAEIKAEEKAKSIAAANKAGWI